MRAELYFIFLILLIASASAELRLPESIGKINDYNDAYFSEFAVKMTFFIAFLAGILGILSPCILPLLPAYFSYTFKEKRNITFMTFVFFLGFSTIFVLMGMIAGMMGEQSLYMIQSPWLIRIAAAFIFLFGIMAFFGKSIALVRINYVAGNDLPGVFLFGILFAVSWTGCLGPVLSGILGIGAVLGNYAQAGLLMFFYGLGSFVPLFLLSVFYDRFDIQKFTKGRSFKFSVLGRTVILNTVNVLSGMLLIASSLFLMIFGSTRLFNAVDPLSTKMLFYEYQNRLMALPAAKWLSVITFAIFVILIIFYRRRKPGVSER